MDLKKKKLEIAILTEKLNSLKLRNWLTECKLVIAFLGAVASVSWFVTNFVSGKVSIKMEAAMIDGPGGSVAGDTVVESAGAAAHASPWNVVLLVLIFVFIILTGYYLVAVVKKHKK